MENLRRLRESEELCIHSGPFVILVRNPSFLFPVQQRTSRLPEELLVRQNSNGLLRNLFRLQMDLVLDGNNF